MAEGRSLYDADFALWSVEQAAAIRAAAASGANLPLDWENLAEEVESLGKSLRRELHSRIGTIVEHLLKLQCSPASDTRRGWIETILRERAEIERLVAANPSLKATLADDIKRQILPTAQLVEDLLDLHDELTVAARERLRQASYEAEQVLGAWLPDLPAGADA